VGSELGWDAWGLVGIVASSKRLWPKVSGRNMASKTRPPAGERVAPAAGRRHAPYQRQRSSNWRCESRAAVSPEAPTRRIRRAARSIEGTAVAAPQPRQPSRAERVLGRLLKAPTTTRRVGISDPSLSRHLALCYASRACARYTCARYASHAGNSPARESSGSRSEARLQQGSPISQNLAGQTRRRPNGDRRRALHCGERLTRWGRPLPTSPKSGRAHPSLERPPKGPPPQPVAGRRPRPS